MVTSYNAASGGGVVNQVRRDYNGLGQLTSEWQSHAGAVAGTTPRVQYGYSGMPGGADHSRPTALTYPDGRAVTSNYATGLDDRISRLSALADPSATLETYAYLGLGTVVRRGRPQPGVDLTYAKLAGEPDGDAGDRYAGLDRFGRVVDQQWVVASTGAAVDRYRYTYDRASNRTARTNGVNAAFGETFTYDGLGQLASFARGTARAQGWDYDALGNWDAVTTDGTAQARGHNRQNEVTSVGGAAAPGFDPAGNMTGDEAGRTLVYDGWHRLAAVSSGGTTLAAYAYDGLGRRVVETTGGTTTDLYHSAQWQVLEERVGGVATTQYVWSPVYVDALVERDRDADGSSGTGPGGREERLYALQDANWNTTALVSTSGAVVERYAYDPFGQVQVLNADFTAKSGGTGYAWTVLFQGLRYSSVTGLDHARNRDYSSTLGRWVTADPIKFAGGDVNLYRFEQNSPTVRLDPSGLYTIFVGADGFIRDSEFVDPFGWIAKGDGRGFTTDIATMKQSRIYLFFHLDSAQIGHVDGPLPSMHGTAGSHRRKEILETTDDWAHMIWVYQYGESHVRSRVVAKPSQDRNGTLKTRVDFLVYGNDPFYRRVAPYAVVSGVMLLEKCGDNSPILAQVFIEHRQYPNTELVVKWPQGLKQYTYESPTNSPLAIRLTANG